MASKDVESILSTLERVFASEIIYDEGCMELGLHTAQVRKQWPNLFKALAGALNSGAFAFSGTYDAAFRRATEPAAEAVNYSEWATDGAHQSKEKDIYHVRWDVEAPMPLFDGSLTLRGPSHRTRFHVDAIDGDVLTLSTVAVLPLSSR